MNFILAEVMSKSMAIINKNYLFFIVPLLIIFIIWISIFKSVMPHLSAFNELCNKTIVIDPGHGGIDGGASANGLLEKDINLSIALKLRTYLEQQGFNVILTRETDVSLDSMYQKSRTRHQRDLNARVNIINNSNPQFFISIHTNCNFKNPRANGAYVFYSTKASKSPVLAHCVQDSLNLGIENNSNTPLRQPQKANFFILSNTKIPGILVEVAFLSNSKDFELLKNDEYRDKIAESIANGAIQYIKNSKYL